LLFGSKYAPSALTGVLDLGHFYSITPLCRQVVKLSKTYESVLLI
jgi:hypothetical protein